MADMSSGPAWSEAQWQRVNAAVAEEFGKACVSGAFLPCYGPLAGSAEAVRNEQLTDMGALVSVSDDTTIKLFNLTVNAQLSSQQIADESLSSALLAFRRAATTLALTQDDVVFNGYSSSAKQEKQESARRSPGTAADLTRVERVVANDPGEAKGLAAAATSTPWARSASGDPPPTTTGNELVATIATAIVELEREGHAEPFACVLGHHLFVEANRPETGLVLPADRITPMLKGGPLLRSGVMPPDRGIVVSLAGNAIDIVVATAPCVQFLQVGADAKSLFRVYERFVLRVKDAQSPSVRSFKLLQKSVQNSPEAKKE
jgi:uncharacterized linocin/CFP29 family protein